MNRSARENPTAGSKREAVKTAGSAYESSVFFEAVLDAFRRREPSAIQEAYLSMIASGANLQGIRALGGKVHFTFQDPDGNKFQVWQQPVAAGVPAQ